MKDSDSEEDRVIGSGESASNQPLPDQTPPDQREGMLNEVFELQLSMLWLAQQAMRELTSRHELLPPHMMILNLLGGRHPGLVVPSQSGLSMSDVSRSLDIPPASATSMMDRLTAQGLVERGPSEQDRRVVMVRLTEQGRGVLQEVMQLWQQVQRDAFIVLSDEQLSAHLALMRRVESGYLQRLPEGKHASFTRPASFAQPAPMPATVQQTDTAQQTTTLQPTTPGPALPVSEEVS
jgi:DNA-binding MarR family transcriptional regulator